MYTALDHLHSKVTRIEKKMEIYEEINDTTVKLQFEETAKKLHQLENEIKLLRRLVTEQLRGY